MDFLLNFPIGESPVKISHGDKVLLLGSCFSDEIFKYFRYNGFDAHSNPFGTIFHPIVLSRFLQQTIEGTHHEQVFQREDIFLSWDASASLYSLSSDDLNARMCELRQIWRSNLESSNTLIVTFGTSWGYRHKELDLIVANCHKIQSGTFQKELTTSFEIVHSWKKTLDLLKKFNPALKVIFTVSPVRHVRDGLVENSRSKAHLISAVEQLCNEPSVYYFPSYEIINDELRDYRFFKSDLVHPNDHAISYVWERFSASFFSAETIRINSEVRSLRAAQEHRTLHPESAVSLRFSDRIKNEINEFLKIHPEILW
jgi:hypothetical protein